MNREQRRASARVRDVKRTAGGARRFVSRDPIALAIDSARKLPRQEVAQMVAPAKAALERMRQGIGTLLDWQHLATAVNISKAIERQGVVRGLAGHLEAAEQALAAINRRAQDEPSATHPYALWIGEIEVLATAVELLFDYQLRQLSRGELTRALTYAINEVESTGGQVIKIEEPSAYQRPLPLST